MNTYNPSFALYTIFSFIMLMYIDIILWGYHITIISFFGLPLWLFFVPLCIWELFILRSYLFSKKQSLTALYASYGIVLWSILSCIFYNNGLGFILWGLGIFILLIIIIDNRLKTKITLSSIVIISTLYLYFIR